MICDFGMARANPILDDYEKQFKELRKKQYKHILSVKNLSERIPKEKNCIQFLSENLKNDYE